MPPVNRNQPTRAASSESRYSLMEFMREYPDDATCLESLWRKRYSPDGEHAHCPKCEEVRAFKRYETAQQRQSWTCTVCGHQLHPTAGTIFHKSSTSLHLWFYAMYLMASTRCGISAKQLERELGRHLQDGMAHGAPDPQRTHGSKTNARIRRHASRLTRPTSAASRRGKKGAKRGRPGPDSPQDAGVRHGRARRARHGRHGAEREARSTLMPHVTQRVLPASTIYTDELQVLRRTDGARATSTTRINHSEGVYVSGDVHTNTIEGFWSLVKRGIGGVYHSVSAKHLQGYLNEYAWRYNHRSDERSQFETLLLRAAGR